MHMKRRSHLPLIGCKCFTAKSERILLALSCFAVQKRQPREAAKFTLLLPGQRPSPVGGEARISAGTSKGFRSLSKQPTKGLAATRRDAGLQDWKPILNANRRPRGGAIRRGTFAPAVVPLFFLSRWAEMDAQGYTC